jgi:4-hydroxy-tetrahydrodipicolinate reductase
MPIELAIFGARGRLGSAVFDAAIAHGVRVVASIGRGDVATSMARPSVVVDASTVEALPDIAAYCLQSRIPLVACTSGLHETDETRLRGLARVVPVIRAKNLAFGHYLQRAALRVVAGGLHVTRAAWEATVYERHPSWKRDRPSATAFSLAALWKGQMGTDVVDIASMRGGLPVSEHSIAFTGTGESLTIVHAVSDRHAAAMGALHAAAWIVNQHPGLWSMDDVYGAPRVEAFPSGDVHEQRHDLAGGGET